MPPTVLPPARVDARDPVLVWLRDSFLSGVAVVLPFAVTFWLLWTFVTFVDANIKPMVGALTGVAPASGDLFWFPGVGLAIAVLALIVLGALTKAFVGRLVVAATEEVIGRLPVVRSIYGGAKQVFKQVAAPERTSFKEAVLAPFPYPGCWTIGFVTNDETHEMTTGLPPDQWIAVYVPQAPIPTTGFLVYYPRSALIPIEIGPEQALKRVISLGIIKEDEPEPDGAAASTAMPRPPI